MIREKQFIPVLLLSLVATSLCLLAAFSPKVFGSSYLLNFSVLCLTLWALVKPVARAFVLKISGFLFSLTAALTFHAILQKAELSISILALYWVTIFCTTLFGINFLLHYLNIPVGLLFFSGANPKSNPEQWKWKEIAYVAAVMRPFAIVIVFVIVTIIAFTFQKSVFPFAAVIKSEPIPLDPASVMFSVLVFPFIFLAGWSLAWKKQQLNTVLNSSAAVPLRALHVLPLLVVVYLWGIIFQISNELSQLYVWTLSMVLVTLLFVAVLRILASARVSEPEPQFPKLNLPLLAFQIVFLVICLLEYYRLLLRGLIGSTVP